MWYYIEYYLKKFRYVILLCIVLLFAGTVYYLNTGELIFNFEIFTNKVSYEPDKYTDQKIDVESYLADMLVGAPYIGNSLTTYVPDSVKVSGSEEEYKRKVKEDPTYVYHKDINWAYGSVNSDELNELVELVGLHLNRVNNIKTIVALPTPDQLEEYEMDVVYYVTQDDGVLHLNLYVEELDESKSNVKSYCYEYKLKYNMTGRIDIR